MNENGLAEGRDYVLHVRWAEGDYTRFAAFTFEERKSSVIIVTTIAAARAAQQLAPSTPIVMTGLIDPVGVGLIASLARPGNNTTGISHMIQDMSTKGLELIREVAPTAKNIVALFNPNNPGSREILEDVRSHAINLGMTVQPMEFKGSAVLNATLEPAVGHDALLVVADSTLLDLGERIAALALQHQLPTFSSIPEFTDAGVLVGYGPSRRDSYRRSAKYVKKVLEGVKPADLPVEQPTLIELSINMQTARALGIIIPRKLARTCRSRDRIASPFAAPAQVWGTKRRIAYPTSCQQLAEADIRCSASLRPAKSPGRNLGKQRDYYLVLHSLADTARQRSKFRNWTWSSKQIALCLLAVFVCKEFEFRTRFNSLGENRKIKCVSKT
jgi:ABC-type uncharacterized transport system substrate-binding protein